MTRCVNPSHIVNDVRECVMVVAFLRYAYVSTGGVQLMPVEIDWQEIEDEFDIPNAVHLNEAATADRGDG